MSTRNYIWYVFICLALYSCKERFDPKLPSLQHNYLVVEGYINAQGPSQIKLSRTSPIGERFAYNAESDAAVWIEGDDNSSFILSAFSKGIYLSTALPIVLSRNYRLRIKTSDAKEYLSDFVEVKITPPIDSVNWLQEDNGIRLYVNTNDPLNKTVYYRWDYDETWQIQSAYVADYKLDSIDRTTNRRIIRRVTPLDPPIFTCWKYDSSKTIHIASSAKLEKDVIYRKPILFIPRMDERLGIRYSIQVTQYALDKQGYQFYEQMKKNTETIGTIFDPLPSSTGGNIHCISHPADMVIGYVNTTTAQQVRIFIAEDQLTGKGFNISSICESKEVANIHDSLRKYIPSAWPYEAIFGSSGGGIIAYKISSENCVDCTLRGGKNVKPSFW